MAFCLLAASEANESSCFFTPPQPAFCGSAAEQAGAGGETRLLHNVAFQPSANIGSSHSYPETTHRLHTILLQWTVLHRDVNNHFMNNSETACVSHLHTRQHPIHYELLLTGFGRSSGQPPVNMEAFIAYSLKH